MASIRYGIAEVDGFNVFFREAGNAGAPKQLPLHGFPRAGHMFRNLIPRPKGRKMCNESR